MSSNTPSINAMASLRESSKRSMAERTKSSLFIGSFRVKSSLRSYQIASRCLLRNDERLLVSNDFGDVGQPRHYSSWTVARQPARSRRQVHFAPRADYGRRERGTIADCE